MCSSTHVVDCPEPFDVICPFFDRRRGRSSAEVRPEGPRSAIPGGRVVGPGRRLLGGPLLDAHGAPLLVSSSRKGLRETPRDRAHRARPRPDGHELERYDRLTAVCHTTAWDPYSAIVQALSTAWYR